MTGKSKVMWFAYGARARTLMHMENLRNGQIFVHFLASFDVYDYMI